MDAKIDFRPIAKEVWVVRSMHCPDCAARLEKALRSIDGVRSASVDFNSSSVSAEFELEKVKSHEIASLIRKFGYPIVSGPGSKFRDPDEDPHEEEGHEGHDHVHGHSHIDEHLHEHAELEREAPPVSAIAGAAFLLLGLVLRYAGFPWAKWLYAASAAVAGWPVLYRGSVTVFSGGGAGIDLLTGISGLGAFILGEWAEAAAVLTLFSIGEYLEEKTADRNRQAIQDILRLAPKTARVKRQDSIVEVPVTEVNPGDVVVIFPGERIPSDGRVVNGESSVNEAPISGESLPVDKYPGDRVFAGSLNGEGMLEVLADTSSKEYTIARIATMVDDARRLKARSERIADAFAKYWTPAMIALAALVSVGVPLVLKAPFRPWIYRGLSILIISCPCSMVISTPVTIIAAISRAARSGVLVKGGSFMEELGHLKAVAFDKTGTVTKGMLEVAEVVPTDGFGALDVLRLASAVESRSEHPIARAIVSKAESVGASAEPGEHFVSIRGKGAKAKVDGTNVYVGNEKMFEDIGVVVPPWLLQEVSRMRNSGQTVTMVGTKSGIVGAVGLKDHVRPEAKEALGKLHRMGLQVQMLTGDDPATASSVAGEIGLGSFRAGLLPDQKLEGLRELMQLNGPVAMVGDGINDAPSLAEASLGIAMGKGADVALEAADVVLMKENLSKIPWAIDLGRKTRELIIQNLVISLGLKALALVLVLGGVLPLWAAVFADSGASVLVSLNGLRVLKFSEP